MAELTQDLQSPDVSSSETESHDDQQASGEQQAGINVGRSGRLGSVLGGSLLALIGLRRRSNLGAVLMLLGGGLIHRGVTGHCHVNSLLGRDTAHGGEPPAPEEYFQRGVHVEQMIKVDKSPEELFRYWRNFANLPRFMDHLQSVTVIDEKKSHWVAKAPAGYQVEWDAEIINEEENSLIAWRSLGGADVDNAGSVKFLAVPEGGTEVRVVLDYLPPAGRLGKWVAKLFGEEPDQQIREDLRLFKKVMEAPPASESNGQ